LETGFVSMIRVIVPDTSLRNIGFWLNIDTSDHSRGFYNIFKLIFVSKLLSSFCFMIILYFIQHITLLKNRCALIINFSFYSNSSVPQIKKNPMCAASNRMLRTTALDSAWKSSLAPCTLHSNILALSSDLHNLHILNPRVVVGLQWRLWNAQHREAHSCWLLECWPSERSHSFNGVSCWNKRRAVEEDFVLLEVAEGGATGSGPSESSYLNYGILCGVEWHGIEGNGSSESSLSH
jgi:hypothetical protein